MFQANRDPDAPRRSPQTEIASTLPNLVGILPFGLRPGALGLNGLMKKGRIIVGLIF